MKTAAELAAGAAALYLFNIKPRLTNRPAPMPKVYYAHRGLHDNGSDAPENTLAAFRKAVEHGYGIELDVQLTKDDRVVVAHDMHLNRICGVDQTIDSLTYGELLQYRVCGSDQQIPLFSDVLALVDGRVPLIVEIKMKGGDCHVCQRVNDLLKHYKGIYCVESFHPAALGWYRKNRPEVCRGQLSTNYQKHDGRYQPVFLAMRHLQSNFLTEPDFIAYDCRDYRAVAKNLCRKLYGCPSVAWTVRSQAQLDEIRDYYDYFIFEGFLPEGEA